MVAIFTDMITDMYDVLWADFLNALYFFENFKKNDAIYETAWKIAHSSSIHVAWNLLYRYLKQECEDWGSEIDLCTSIKFVVLVWLHCDKHQFLMSCFCLSFMTIKFRGLIFSQNTKWEEMSIKIPSKQEQCNEQ